MTHEARFDRQLPAVLEDLYLGPTPDYRTDVLDAATATRQRPAWTFPGRWIPMADIASRPAYAPRLPWRALGVAFLIVMLVGAAVAYIGSHQTRVPAPFGVAKNGVIAYARDGDIYTTDPVSGEVRAIVTGPDVDRRPAFSRDGSHIAFLRQLGNTTSDAFALVVAGADGSGPHLLRGPGLRHDGLFEWAPDGTYLMVGLDEGVFRYDASGTASPVKVVENARFLTGSFRPPDGRQILVQPDDPSGFTLAVMNADGTGSRPIWHIASADASDNDVKEFHWSPDGTRIAFVLGPGGDNAQQRVYVMRADGSDVVRLSTTEGTWVEADLVWSPDGTRIAFNRWRQDQTSLGWIVQPIGIVSVDGGPVRGAGPAPVSDGASFDWSPDGTSIVSTPGTLLQWPAPPISSANPVIIDPTTGTATDLGWTVSSATSWQRRAP